MRILPYLLVTSILCLSACSDMPEWLGGADTKKPLPGARISVLAHEQKIAADTKTAGLEFNVPDVTDNAEWPTQNCHPGENLQLPDALTKKDSFSVGSAPVKGLRLTSTPVIAGGVIFAIDGSGKVTARSVEKPGDVVWEFEIPTGEMKRDLFGLGFKFDSTTAKDFLGGNIAYGDGMLLVATADGMVYALDAGSGEQRWKRDVKIPVRSSPVVEDGVVYLVTTDNRLYALFAKDGSTKWTHDGMAETTSILGAPSPLIDGELILVPYSSGELYAIERESGRPRWGSALANNELRRTSLVALNDINASPIVYQGSVYAVSNDGILKAYNLDTGSERWHQELSSVNTPWPAGDFLFIISSAGDMVAVHTLDGKIKWVSELTPEDKEEKPKWQGPVMAGGKLYAVSTDGEMVAVNPETGKVENTYEVPEETYLAPIVAGSAVYTLDNDAKLTVWR